MPLEDVQNYDQNTYGQNGEFSLDSEDRRAAPLSALTAYFAAPPAPPSRWRLKRWYASAPITTAAAVTLNTMAVARQSPAAANDDPSVMASTDRPW